MKSRQLDKRICPICKESFIPKSEKNIFSSRACFKKDYYHRKKAEELAGIKFPEFTCPDCGQQIILNFDPAKESVRWTKYICPGCNTLMINVSEQIVTSDVYEV